MRAVYGGECVDDDYNENLTPETAIINLPTEGAIEESSRPTTEQNVIEDEVEPITEEIEGSGEEGLDPITEKGNFDCLV